MSEWRDLVYAPFRELYFWCAVTPLLIAYAAILVYSEIVKVVMGAVMWAATDNLPAGAPSDKTPVTQKMNMFFVAIMLARFWYLVIYYAITAHFLARRTFYKINRAVFHMHELVHDALLTFVARAFGIIHMWVRAVLRA